MEKRARYRVRSERQSAHGVDVGRAETRLLKRIQQQVSDERRGSVVQGRPAQVYVVIRLLA